MQIIEDARVLVSEHGMEGLTIRNLARSVGVTEGAIYRHFRSKHEILLGLIDDIEARLRDRMEPDESDARTPLDVLENVLRSRLSHAERERGVLSIVVAEVLLNGDAQLRQRMMEVIEGYLKRVESLLEIEVQQGRVRPDINIRAAAILFFGLVQGVNTIRHFATEEPATEEYEALWQAYTKGILQ